MNYKQRELILSSVYTDRAELYYTEDSEYRTAKLKDLKAAINAFKKLTAYTLDEVPESMEPYEGLGERVTVQEWGVWVIAGCFVPSDGSGHWATEGGFSYAHSDVFGAVPSWATHIVWCNK